MNRMFLSCTLLAGNFLIAPPIIAREIKLDLPATLEKAQKEYGPLLAFDQTELTVQGIVQKATRLPNPELAFSWEDFLSTETSGFQHGKYSFELQMPLELGGKRSAREESALAEADVVTLESEKQKADLLVEIAKAFLDLKEKDALMILAQERSKLASKLADIATQKLKAGKLSGVEQGKLSSLAALAGIELVEREIIAKNASKRAATYIGMSSVEIERFFFPFDHIPEVSTIPSEDWTQTFAARIARAKSKKSFSEVTLAGRESFPDLMLKVGTIYDRTTEENSFSVGFSLPLPLFDRNQGGRKLAQAFSEADIAREKSLKPDTLRELSEVSNSLELSRSKALLLKKEIIPKLRESAALLAEAYEKGRVNYLELVETQESLFSVEEKYVETLSKFHSSVFSLVFASQVNLGLAKIADLYSFEANK